MGLTRAFTQLDGMRDALRGSYPYAAGGAVTYMPSGQRFLAGQQTKGGWIRAPELAPGQETLSAALIRAGLLRTAPAGGSSSAWRTVSWITAAALAAAALFALRRRPRSVPTMSHPDHVS
jgi:hypothetical protein